MTLMPVAKAPTASRKSRALKIPDSSRSAKALLDDLIEVARGAERLGDDVAEVVALHRQESGRRGRPDRGRARAVAHDRGLAEEVPRAVRPEPLLLAVLLGDHLELALHDDEELVGRAPLPGEDLALADRHS